MAVQQKPEAGYTPAWQAESGGIGVVGTPERFDPGEYAAGKGYDPFTPEGQPMPTTMGGTKDFVKKYYDMDLDAFTGATKEERYQAYAGKTGAAPTYEAAQALFDPITGEATRPPKNRSEAAWMQFTANQITARRNEQNVRNALAVIQKARGSVRRGGQGSIAEVTQPLATKEADILMATQHEASDYSFWRTPGAYGVTESELGEETHLMPSRVARQQRRAGGRGTGYMTGWV